MLCPCASAGSTDAFVLNSVTRSLITLLVTVRLTVRLMDIGTAFALISNFQSDAGFIDFKNENAIGRADFQ